jgi:hypothetical protein
LESTISSHNYCFNVGSGKDHSQTLVTFLALSDKSPSKALLSKDFF